MSLDRIKVGEQAYFPCFKDLDDPACERHDALDPLFEDLDAAFEALCDAEYPKIHVYQQLLVWCANAQQAAGAGLLQAMARKARRKR